MSETPSAERYSRAKAIYGLAVFLLVTAHGLVLFLSWLIKAVRPDWPLRPLLSEEGVRWLFGHFTDNLLSPLLVWLLLGLCAVSALRGSHLPGAIRRLRSWPTMAYRERLALRSVLFEVVLVAAVLILLTAPSHAILLNVSGSLYPSSFSASIFAVGCLTVITASLTYAIIGADGKKSGSIFHILTDHADGLWLLPIYIITRQLWCMIAYVLG